MRDLQQRFDLTLVFISHDLRIVRQLCSKIAVMFLGKIVECGFTEDGKRLLRYYSRNEIRAALKKFARTLSASVAQTTE